MDTLYHITRTDYLSAIMSRGLRIDVNRQGIGLYPHDYIKRYGQRPIFLTADADHIWNTQIGRSESSWLVLAVNVIGLKLEPEYDYLHNHWNQYFLTYQSMLENIANDPHNTFICRQSIPPERLTPVRCLIAGIKDRTSSAAVSAA
jgi:hypothetical protein